VGVRQQPMVGRVQGREMNALQDLPQAETDGEPALTHLVAAYLVPLRVGQLPCRLPLSRVPSVRREKNSTAAVWAGKGVGESAG
jgi:hypothetical protein